MSSTGTVFNIQHFTIHDGPGIRTELFLKGCPLRCEWCGNPESHRPEIEPGVFRKKCVGRKSCGLCEAACPEQKDNSPLVFYRNRLEAIDREKCTGCMACADVCPSEAVKIWGRRVSAEEAMKEVRRDRGYYERSGGGVTVSGGEPLIQADFVAEIFEMCRKEGISTCLESCMYVPWENVEKLLPLTDLWIADLKIVDSSKHREYIGAGNELILENLKRLAASGADIILRIPVIPHVNDTDGNMAASADFILNEMGGRIRTLQLLSFMRLGEEKYASLGKPYAMSGTRFRRDHFQRKIAGFADYFNSRGIHTVVGTREKS